MRRRRAVWRAAGPAVGARFPRTSLAVYESMTRSAARALLRRPGVAAVFLGGSGATGGWRPGSSDIDLNVVLDPGTDAAAEVARLRELRGPYTRRQAILPIDLAVYGLPELARHLPLANLARSRIGRVEPCVPLRDFAWPAGERFELGALPQPDPRLAALSDAPIRAAFAASTMAGPAGVAAALARLAAQVVKDGANGPEAIEFVAAHAALAGSSEPHPPARCPACAARNPTSGTRSASDPAVEALATAIELLVAERARTALPLRAPDAVRLDPAIGVPPSVAVAAARAALAAHPPPAAARSLTLLDDPESARASLLLEVPDGDPAALRAGVAWALAATPSLTRGSVEPHVLTTGVAVDCARGGLRWRSLLGGGLALGGDPLASRARLLEPELLDARLRFLATMRIQAIRRPVFGQRDKRASIRDIDGLAIVRELALHGAAARTNPAVTAGRLRAAAVGQAQCGTELWRDWLGADA